MKLVFKKNEESQINVLQDIDGQETSFSYVDMIKNLIKSKKMEDPTITGDFTDAETKSIKSMVKFINDEISTTEDIDSPE